MEEFMMDLATEPDHPGIQTLLEVAHQSHVAVHRALQEAGAHFTSCGDSPAGPDLLSPALFRRFARPFEERLVRAVDWPVLIHICGDTTKILDQLSEYPVCAFELDYKTDARRAKATVGRRHILFGNVDPSGVLARGAVTEVVAKTRELLALWKPGGRFVLNAGCAIPAGTPSENLRAFLRTAQEYGQYD
jgi:MtaA/CmuA family methyltransferase